MTDTQSAVIPKPGPHLFPEPNFSKLISELKTPAALVYQPENELTYEEMAQLVLAELVKRYPHAAEGSQKAFVDQGRYPHIGPQVWVLTWDGGPQYWAYDYKTKVDEVYTMAYSETATMIHLDRAWLRD